MGTIVLVLLILAALAFLAALVDPVKWARLVAGGLLLWAVVAIIEHVT